MLYTVANIDCDDESAGTIHAQIRHSDGENSCEHPAPHADESVMQHSSRRFFCRQGWDQWHIFLVRRDTTRTESRHSGLCAEVAAISAEWKIDQRADHSPARRFSEVSRSTGSGAATRTNWWTIRPAAMFAA